MEKAKSPTAKAGLSTDELVTKLRKLNRIISHSKEEYKVGNSIVEMHRITGELYRRNLRVK